MELFYAEEPAAMISDVTICSPAVSWAVADHDWLKASQ